MQGRTYHITAGGIDIAVTRKNVKNMYLRVRREDGAASISAPFGASEESVREFARGHIEWIRRHQERYEAERRAREELRGAEGEPLAPMGDEAERKRRLKERAEEIIARYEPVMGVSVSGVTIRLMKTRWGSCNVRTRHVNLNLALESEPPECLEYVVVHEMTHILAPAHDEAFWGYMTRFYPNWKSVRDLLRGHAPAGT